MSDIAAEGAKISFFQSLKERRVAQIVGFYLGAGWGLVQFVEWIVERYGLSPYLPDFSLVILLSLVPSVVVVGYFHGRPGRDHWNRVELVSIPLNLAFTGFLLFSLFSGKDLGAATQTLLVKNEEGQTIKQVIAKSEFRKKIILFNIHNKSGDAQLDWLESGLPLAINIDLLQDPFLNATSQLFNVDLYQSIKRSGFPQSVNLPLTLMQKIATEMHYDFFAFGELNVSAGQFKVDLKIVQSDNGKKISNQSFSSSEPISLADSISVSIKQDLEIPDYHIDSIQDLPINELLSANQQALQNLVLGIEESAIYNNYQKAAAHLEQSVAEDPAFAIGHFFQSVIYANANRSDESISAVKKALKFEYKLPNAIKFQAKDVFYIMTGQAQKRVDLLKMQVELYPENINARLTLANIYENDLQYQKAIDVYLALSEIAPQPEIYLDDIGFLFARLNQMDKALEYVKAYADHFPQEPISFINLAQIYAQRNNIELEKESYQKAQFLDSSNLTTSLNLADIDVRQGDFSQALEKYNNLMLQAEDAKDQFRVLIRLTRFHAAKGQPIKSLNYYKEAMQAIKMDQPPLSATIQEIIEIDRYIRAGETEQAFEILAAARQNLKAPFDKLSALGYVAAYIELKDLENATKSMQELSQAMESIGNILGGLQNAPIQFNAEIAEISKDYEKSLNLYQQFANSNQQEITRLLPIARVQRKLGQLDAAAKSIQQQLSITPFSAEVHYQAGLIYAELNDTTQAKRHLEDAVNIWSEAEEIFEPAKDARTLLAKLTD